MGCECRNKTLSYIPYSSRWRSNKNDKNVTLKEHVWWYQRSHQFPVNHIFDLFCENIETLFPGIVIGDSWWGIHEANPGPCSLLVLQPGCSMLSLLENTVIQRCIAIVETRTSHWGLKKSICVLGGTVITRPGRLSFIQAPLIGWRKTLFLHSCKVEEKSQNHSSNSFVVQLEF